MFASFHPTNELVGIHEAILMICILQNLFFSQKKPEIEKKARQAYVFLFVVFLLVFFGMVALSLQDKYACFERLSEKTFIVSEGCSNQICDLGEYQAFLTKGAYVCIDCYLIPHCRVIGKDENMGFLVDFNGQVGWTGFVQDYCKIQISKSNEFVIGSAEYYWKGDFSHYSSKQDENYLCEKVSFLSSFFASK